MNIMELGAIGELVGGVAVVASLIYVGLQVRQNTQVTRTNSAYQLYELFTKVSIPVIENAGVAEIVERGSAEPTSLSAADWTRFTEYAYVRFGTWEAAFLSHKRGTIDLALWESWDEAMRQVLAAPGFQKFWEESRAGYVRTFQDHISSFGFDAPKEEA